MRRQYAARNLIRNLAVAALVALVAGSAHARSFGIDSGSMDDGPATCTGLGCHLAGASDDVFVTITGPQELGVDETGDYTIEIFENVAGALQMGAGVNVAAFLDDILTDLDDGILAEDALNTQLTEGMILFVLDGQLTHVAATSNDPDFSSIGVFSYDFTVTAPSTEGVLELRGAMNAFNGDGQVTGEIWNNTSFFVTVPEPGGVALSAIALATLAALRRRRR